MQVDATLDTEIAPAKNFRKLLFSFGRINNVQYMGLISFWSAITCIMFIEAIFFIKLPSLIGEIYVTTDVTFKMAYLVLIGGTVIVMANFILIAIRRLHDCNLRGWWWFLILVPVVGLFLGISLLIMPGSKGNNRFGLQPARATLFHYSLLLFGPVMFGFLYYLVYSLLT